ncbi:MAG TPA: glycosyltransferase family 1 protein [Verrucomicrobiae bacterium]|nr:glycosyltransferase family 1 protein [Verrucomicrobiae bacterium]
MLYIDVTSSCKSPMNGGVQRMVRGIFTALRRCRSDVMPLLWSPKLGSYCQLSKAEWRFLVDPFADHRGASARPEGLSSPFPWSKAVRYLRHWRHRFALDAAATSADLLLVPEIFQDNRVNRLRDVQTWFPGPCGAVFHDAIALRLPEYSAPGRRRNFREYVCALASFDKVVCVSREAESDLRSYWDSFGVTPTTTIVLGWPIDFGQPRPAPQPNFGARRALYVATLDRRKNHLTLLEAAEKLWGAGLNFELVLIGRTTADWGATVLGELGRLRKRGRPLKWLRHVSDHALHRAYRDCSFTVYPSVREGFGLPILESLWHGRPCICGANGAIGEAADGGGCLTVTCTDATALAGGMRALLTDQAAYRRLFDQARDRAFRSWDDYIDELFRAIGTG